MAKVFLFVSPMTLDEALDIVVARTKHGRYRELCDPSHPDYDPEYISVVIAMAEGTWKEPDPPVTADGRPARRQAHWIALAKQCPYRERTDRCGCGVSICHAHRGQGLDPTRVNLTECVACVAGMVAPLGSTGSHPGP